MSNNFADYNVVAVGDSAAWQTLEREVSKIRNCKLLRVPTLLNPYGVTDKYHLRAIFLLPDAIKIYQGVCRAWIQRFRFGPNVNTPIICIVEGAAERKKAEELNQMLQTNAINWILTTQELSALLLVCVIRYSQAGIRRRLDTSARQIVNYAIQSAAQLRGVSEAATGNRDEAPADPLEWADDPKKSPRDEVVIPLTSQLPKTSRSQQRTARTKKRLRDPCSNHSPSCAQTQREANGHETEDKKKPATSPSTSKRVKLQHQANQLNKKLDMARIYISKVQSLLDRETSPD
ncbi:uncharacterized protein LOC110975103 [Acanthaster planci]|uniref:Uncharacterized protein LOC110975103 n=1 Tax=Acanthaster planci TaxID=133434 RepID=A0A8B7XQ46_ACAPL|nr:uncharacterized protein LOC110975103 [Acanthaster planci]